MRPTKLILNDWCQHQSLEIVFVQGLNSLQGPNGSGKTNILEALNLCLSLDTNNPGKKTDGIRNGCDTASLLLVFEHQDVEGQIEVRLTRNYRTSWDELSTEIELARRAVEANNADPTQSVTPEQLKLATFKPRETIKYSLKWADVECRTATEVGDFIRQQTLLDPKTIKTNYFPRQGDVDGAMSSDQETRQRIFHDKAGTALCQKIWEELGKELRSIPDYSQAEQAMREAEARLAVSTGELTLSRQQVQDLQELPQDISGPQEIVRRYMQALQAQKDLQALQLSLSQAQTAVQERRAELDRLVVDGQQARTAHDQLAPQVEVWQKQVWDAQQAVARQKQRQEKLLSFAQARDQLQTLTEPPPAAIAPETAQELQAEATRIQQRVQQLDQWLRTFADGRCPTCGQPVDQQVVQQYQQERQQLNPTAALTAAQQADQALKAYQQAVRQFEVGRAQLQTQIDQLQQQLAQLPEEQLSDVSQAESGLQAYQQAKTRLEQLRAAHAQALQAFNQAQSQHDLLDQRLKTALQVDGQDCPTEEQFRQAGEQLTTAQFNQQQLRDAQIALGVLEKRVADLEQDLQQRRTEAEKLEPSRVWSSMLIRARELLHQNNLPSQVVAWYAEQLAHHTQVYLDAFEAGFQLLVSSDLGLVGVFPDKVISASRFSGGEKNMTNICMRLAMIDLFPSNLQLLVLDEVEVHLDQEKVSKLPVILESVKALARNRGLVVLFISHHPSLVGISDHAINLAA